MLNDRAGPLCRIFGVPFLKFALPFAEGVQKELIEKAYFLVDKDRHKNKSNIGGFHSNEIAELDWETFDAGKWFTTSVNKVLLQALRILHNTHTPEIEIELTNSWYVVNEAKASHWNIPHTHPGSYLSGAFYLSAQPEIKGTGRLIAIVENSSISSIQKDSNDIKLIEYLPVEGELILFPSSTIHMVSPHTADYDRIMISFNTRIKTTDDTVS